VGAGAGWEREAAAMEAAAMGVGLEAA